MYHMYGVGGFGWGFHLHMIFATLIFLGVVFVLMYAWKNLNKKELQKWIVWFLVVGVVGALITSQFAMGGKVFSKDGWKFMQEMMDGDTDLGPAADVPAAN